MDELACPDCDGSLVLRDIKGMGTFYGCTNYPECKATHGAHPDGRLLGIPADALTREARILAHEAFDLLWEDALRMYKDTGERSPEFLLRVARARAYSWLGWRLDMKAGECHIGKLDAFHCELVIVICKGITPEHVRPWAKQKRHRERVAKVLRMHGTEQHEMELVDDV